MQAAADMAPPPIDPSSLGMSDGRLAQLETTLRACVADGQLPFARMKVLRHGQIVYDVTVNSELGTQTEDSIYRYYSMTKIVASVTCLLAVERGLMRLDDPVEKYIPEMKDAVVVVGGSAANGDLQTVPAASMPTIRQCLTHTAGMGYGGLSTAGFSIANDEVDRAYLSAGCGADMLDGSMTRWESLEELAATLAAQPLRHHPGTLYDYAMGHILAGRCVEVAMGGQRTLTQIIKDEIFEPLEMHRAGWGAHQDTDSRVLPMYRYTTFEFPDPARPWLNRVDGLELHRQESARIHDHCKSQELCARGLCLMPDAQMTGTADDVSWPRSTCSDGVSVDFCLAAHA